MYKTNTKNIDKYFTITILSMLILLVVGILILFVSTVYYGINLWVGMNVYLFIVNIPFIVFTVSHIGTLNLDSVNNSTAIKVVYNNDRPIHKTKKHKHLVVDA